MIIVILVSLIYIGALIFKFCWLRSINLFVVNVIHFAVCNCQIRGVLYFLNFTTICAALCIYKCFYPRMALFNLIRRDVIALYSVNILK
jgi:hypothetical protein